MRKLALCAAALSLFAITGPIKAGESPSKHRDIENKVEQFVAAWNEHDCDAMANKWEKDGDLINPFGREARGRVEIRRLFDDEHHHGMMYGTHLAMSIESVKMIDNHVAVVDGTCRITGARHDGADLILPEDHVTIVMHEDWGWHFSSVRAYVFEEGGPVRTSTRVIEEGRPVRVIEDGRPVRVVRAGTPTVGLLVHMEAKPGREKDVEEFLASGLPLAEQEPDTVAWFGIRISPSEFAIFDVFPSDVGRQAHLSGKIAASLMGRAPELFTKPPVIEKVDVVGAKLP